MSVPESALYPSPWDVSAGREKALLAAVAAGWMLGGDDIEMKHKRRPRAKPRPRKRGRKRKGSDWAKIFSRNIRRFRDPEDHSIMRARQRRKKVRALMRARRKWKPGGYARRWRERRNRKAGGWRF